MSSSADILFTNENAPAGEDLRLSAVPQLRRVDARRYQLGLSNIDAMMKPLHAGEFFLLGAREGHGKTSMAEHLMLENARESKVLVASLDMPKAKLQDRAIAKLIGCSEEDVVRHRGANSAEYQFAMEVLERLDLLVWSPDGKHRTPKAIMQKAEDVSADILIVDYCRLMRGWEPGSRAAAITDELVDWTHASMITTIMLTQLRDEAVGKRPHNGHIQDTTQLAQRADRIALLYRPYLGSPHRDTVTEVIFTKNRRGPTFRGHVGWVGPTMDYFPMEAEQEQNVTCCRNR